MTLEQQTEAWVAPFEKEPASDSHPALIELDPDAGEALLIAALTHDVERNFPGSPKQPANLPANDRAYRDAHQARSAELVTKCHLEQQASPTFIETVAGLVRVHEWGGTPPADLLQAADSISSLETTAPLGPSWIQGGRYNRERTEEQLNWMFDRIRLPRAKRIARPFFDAAMGGLDG